MEDINKELRLYLGLLCGDISFFNWINKNTEKSLYQIETSLYETYPKDGWKITMNSRIEPTDIDLIKNLKKIYGSEIKIIILNHLEVKDSYASVTEYECTVFIHSIKTNTFYSIDVSQCSDVDRNEINYEIIGELTLLKFENVFYDYGINFVKKLGELFDYANIIKFIKNQN